MKTIQEKKAKKSITVGNNGKRVENNHHYDGDRCPAEVLLLCKTARVALNGQNISPVLGLYHGSLGIIEDIVYHAGERPQHGDLPAYVLVKFTQYCRKELVPHAKQSVPIPPMISHCSKWGCCPRTYIPLTLAYGKHLHWLMGKPFILSRDKLLDQQEKVDQKTRFNK
jgi:hypothetical protein